jgi:RNA polymerase sigma-70 factor (ECF subfamily)
MTTHWSMVLAAGGDSSPQTREALAALCQGYWFPLYAFVRRSGFASHDAEELTQGFFAQLIEKDYLSDVHRERGKFRSFLLTAMKHFLSKHREWAKAQKRGGGRRPISLDTSDAEARYRLEPQDLETPERLYHRRWALTLLDRVLIRLRDEYSAAGREAQFDQFQPLLTGSGTSLPYREIADRLSMTEGAIKVAVHRLRKRYRELLREEIARTVSSPAEVEDELNELFVALSSSENRDLL